MKTLLKSLNLLGPSGSPLPPKKKIKAYLSPSGWSGCAWWRYRVPFGKLSEIGSDLLDFFIENQKEKATHISKIMEHVGESDVLSFQAPGSWEVCKVMDYAMSIGKKMIIDYDDFSFDLDPCNPRYNQLGIKETEVKDTNGKTSLIWRDMENEFDLKSNIDRYNAFLHSVSSVNMITTTTEYIADKFRRLNPNVSVLPNSIDFDLYRPISRPEAYDNQIRIGWFGGDSHYEDLKILKPVFKRLTEKYPNIKLVFLAPAVHFWADVFEGINSNRIDWHEWSDLSVFPLALAARQFDIGVVPLADSEFNKCKSNIKWLEFSSLKVPVVAQKMFPYSNSINDGEDGMLANNEDEWMEKISLLIESKDLRKKISEQAYNRVKKEFNLEKNCRIWEQAYVDVFENPGAKRFECQCVYCKEHKESTQKVLLIPGR